MSDRFIQEKAKGQEIRECQECGDEYNPEDSNADSPSCFCSDECEMVNEEGESDDFWWLDNEFDGPEAEGPDWNEVMG